MFGGYRDRHADSFQCQSFLLAERERKSSYKGSIGYTFGNVMSFDRTDTLISHTGCVNTLKWSKDGTKLISGSDDRTIKIWNYNPSSDGTSLRHTIRSGHRSNIFCADFSPICESLIVSCAADGTLYKNDLNSTSSEVRLMKSEGLMHMFIFDVDQPQIVYTAEDLGRGIISRVDLRTNVVDTIFSTRYLNLDAMFNGVRCVTETMSSVKALAQNDVYGGSQLLIGGGRSFSLGLLDVRCLSPVPTGTDVDYEITGAQFVKKWEPQRHPHLQNKISKHRMNGVSVSGLTFSSNGASILASYQGDQIYIFDTFGETSKIATKKASVADAANANEPPLFNTTTVSRMGPRSLLGGHINHATFLKSVAFFGPKDEYVVSGSDSGHLWVWDATSGNLDVDEAHDRTCRVINFLKADESTCNGVVPHPYAPLFGTYGIASDVKIWACDVPSPDRQRKQETPGGRAFLPRSCMMNKMIENETEYQGRGLDLEKKIQRSEYCDMDRLHTYLKIQNASITNGDNDPPLVSDLAQYEITVRAIRTDPLTSRCSGDGLHLPADYQVRSVAIGPDYLTDYLNYLKRRGWKELFSQDEKQSIEKVAYDLFVAGIGKLESERDEHEDRDSEEQSESDIKNITKTVPLGNSDTAKTNKDTNSNTNTNTNTNTYVPPSLADLQLSLFAEMESMSVDDIWGVFKTPNGFGEMRKPFDFFPVSCVAFCEIYRIGNAIKQLGNIAFKNKQSGCARILYEKALRYGDKKTPRMSPVFMTWEGSCVTPERSVSPPPHKKGRGTHGMYLFPGGEESDSDDDTEDSYDEFEDGIEEEIGDTMEREDMGEGSFYEDEYDEEEEEEEEEEDEEEEEEEEEEMECVEYEGSEYCLGSPLCAERLSTASETMGHSSNMDSCSNNLFAKPSHPANSGNEVREEEELEMVLDTDVSNEGRKEEQTEQASVQNEIYDVEGKIKYRTVSNVGVEGSGYDPSKFKDKVNTEKVLEAEKEAEVEVVVAEKRAKVRTVTEDLTTPVCASRLLSSSSTTLHFVTPDSSFSRNNGIIIPDSSESFVPDKKLFDEKKGTKKSFVEVESTPIESPIDNDEEGSTVFMAFEFAERICQREREVSVHVVGVIQEYVINTFMTELSLACLSNLIATDLQAEDYPRAKKTFHRALAYIDRTYSVPTEVHAKLLFRGACSLFSLGERAAALSTLQDAHKLVPNDKMILKKLKEFRSAQDAVNTAEKRKYSKMFAK